MVKLTIDMDRLGKQLSTGTHQLSQQAVSVAHAAAASIAAGLKTCDERSGGNLNQFEICIDQDPPRHPNKQAPFNHSAPIKFQPVTIPNIPVSLSSTQSGPYESKIWGASSFSFSLQLETQSPRSGYLVASATSKLGAPLPVKCTWKRVIGGAFFDIPNFFETAYPISADDVGCKLLVEARPAGASDPMDVAYGEIGMFDLDCAARRNLDNYLALGETEFPVMCSDAGSVKQTDVDAAHDHMCHLNAEGVEIIKSGLNSVGFIENWSCKYGAEYPTALIDPRHLTALELHLSPKNKLRLQTVTRSQRDLLVLTMRCFQGRQYLANTVLLRTVSLSAGKQMSALTQFGQSESIKSMLAGQNVESLSVDYFVLLQRLTIEIHRLLSVTEKSLKDRDRANTEKNALEADMNSTISIYQQLLNETSPNAKSTTSSTRLLSMGAELSHSSTYTKDLEHQLKESQKQCEKYLVKLQKLQKSVDTLESQTHLKRLQSLASNEASQERFAGQSTDDQSAKRVQSQQSDTPHDSSSLHNRSWHLPLEGETPRCGAPSQLFIGSITTPRLKHALVQPGLRDRANQDTHVATLPTTRATCIVGAYDEEKAKLHIAELEQELALARHEMEELITSRNRYEKQVQVLKRDVDKMQNQLQAVMEVNNEVNGATTVHETNIRQMKEKILNQAEHVGTINALRQQLSEALKENEVQQALINQLKKENEMFRSKIRKFTLS